MLTVVRKGEIACALLKYRIKKEGIYLDAMNREIGNIAAATSIPAAELREFAEKIMAELMAEVFEKTV